MYEILFPIYIFTNVLLKYGIEKFWYYALQKQSPQRRRKALLITLFVRFKLKCSLYFYLKELKKNEFYSNSHCNV